MNWQTIFAFSDTANWILLTAFHSLWLSLISFLIIQFRKFRSPVIRSTLCTCTLILLLALPLIVWFIPQIVVSSQTAPKVAVVMSAPMQTFETEAPLLNRLLDIRTPLPQSPMNQLKERMNQFGFLWLAVALICVGRLFFQLAFLRGFCSGLQEIRDDRISAALKEIEQSFNFRKKPRFFVSHKLTSPISTGIQTPLVVLPASLYRSIGDRELRAILLHELAHIYHGDHLLGLLQRMIKSLYWWNPFVYGVCNSLSVAREEVSDNYSISGMESAASYARLLVDLVEKTSFIDRPPCTAGLGTPYELLETRIAKIVSKERDMRVKINKRMMSLIVLTAVLLCGVFVIGSQVTVFGVGKASPSGLGENEAQASPRSGESNIVDSSRLALQFEGADLYEFIKHMAPSLGLTPIIIDPNVKGKVTLMNPSPMSKDDVMPLFHMILKNNNAALVKQGDVYRIVPIAAAVKKGADVVEQQSPAAPAVQKDNPRLMLQFEDADLYEFIKHVAPALGLTPIIIDPEVKGKVTLINSSPMQKDDVLPLFRMILKNNNAALVKQDDVYQIVPIAAAVK